MMRIFKQSILLAVLFASLLTLPPQPVMAANATDFQPGNIINDSIFYRPDTMSSSQVQAFLNAKVPTCRSGYTCLKDYVQDTQTRPAEAGLCAQYNGGRKSSAQIIVDVSIACGINPQTILVLLQKEQSLVTDDWPWDIQYRSATGYGCPDTAACDAEYYGFFNQVYHAARQYKLYARDAGSYNFRTGRSNTIQWHPNAGCGTSSVFIYSQATAGLYNYTPYRPNQAALNNLYGSGDECSAYGNRNFWRLFTDWFGSTTGGVGLVRANSGGTTYAWYDGKKQGIPTPDVLEAWGLDRLPTTLMDDTSLAAIPERSTILTRLAKNPYTNGLYLLADKGGTYDSLANMASNWGYSPQGASEIGNALIAHTSRLGGLSAFMTAPNTSGIYAVDNGQTRLFSTSENFMSWSSGSFVTTISSSLFSQLGTGSAILSNQAQSSSGTQYVLRTGQLLTIPSEQTGLYPRTSATTISNQLVDVLPNGGNTSRFIKSSDSGAIYLVDNGTRHAFPSLSMLFAYAPSRESVSVTVFSPSEIAHIPVGNPVLTRFAYDLTDTTKQYYINTGPHTVPSATFAVNTYGFGISPAGLALTGSSRGPISCTQGFVQAAGSPGISILDNGSRRGLASIEMLLMVNNSIGNVCVLNPEDVNIMPQGAPMSVFVSNGGVNYLLEQNRRYTVDTSVAQTIGIGTVQPVSLSFLNNYTDSGALTSNFRTGTNYIFTNDGKYFDTNNTAIATLWGVNTSSQQHTPLLTKFLTRGGSLIPFARPSDTSNGTIFLVDNGKFLPIGRLEHLFNAGFNMQQIPMISLAHLNANLGTTWHGYLAVDSSSGSTYLLEGGKKHLIPGDLLSRWTASHTPTPLTSLFLGLLSNGSNVTRSVETGAPGIYGIDNGKKAGIPNLTTYNNRYAPALKVTDQLIQSIPYGPPIVAD